MTYVNFWRLQGRSSTLVKIRGLQKVCLLNEGVTGRQSGLGVLGGQVPRLYGGTIFGRVRHPRGVWRGFESKGSVFQNLCRIFLTPQISEF